MVAGVVVAWLTLVDMLLCVVVVGAAAAAPHMVNVNAKQKTKKPNLLLKLDLII